MSTISTPSQSESDHHIGPDFSALIEQSTEGLAILDQQRRIVYLNPAGASFLGGQERDLIGTVVDDALDASPSTDHSGEFTRIGRASLQGRRGPLLVDVIETTKGEYIYVSFRDRTEQSRLDAQYSAFVRAAATLATVQSQKALLDDVAECVLTATGQAACTVVSYDRATSTIKQVGTAGGYPEDYADRLNGCLERGAPLASLEAFLSGELIIGYDWRDKVLADDRWAPVHATLRDAEWGSLVAVPLRYQDKTLGSVTLFYRRGQDPGKGDVRFISTIGEMAAVAMVNHELATRRARESALEERHRIARDLHDSVSQKIFGISLRSRALQMAVESRPGAPAAGTMGAGTEIADQLGDLYGLSVDALADMREMIHHLRPEALESAGLIGLIRRHAEGLVDSSDIDIRVSSQVESPDLSYADQLELYRIVQEAMGNAVRHSGADVINVRLTADENSVTVHVRDDGDGFDIHEREGHYGLRTMAERASKLGAAIAIDSSPGSTTVRVTVPVRGAVRFSD